MLWKFPPPSRPRRPTFTPITHACLFEGSLLMCVCVCVCVGWRPPRRPGRGRLVAFVWNVSILRGPTHVHLDADDLHFYV